MSIDETQIPVSQAAEPDQENRASGIPVTQPQVVAASTHDDPFASLFNLEEQYQAEGYAKGEEDGAVAGRAEGRLFGMQRGFERFSEMGRLHAQAVVLQSRMNQSSSAKDVTVKDDVSSEFLFFNIGGFQPASDNQLALQLPNGVCLRPVPMKRRLKLGISKLYSLTEPESLSFENNEDDVKDFDERLSSAQSTAEIVRRTLGEDGSGNPQSHDALEVDIQNQGRKKIGTDIEDVDVSRLMQRPSRRAG